MTTFRFAPPPSGTGGARRHGATIGQSLARTTTSFAPHHGASHGGQSRPLRCDRVVCGPGCTVARRLGRPPLAPERMGGIGAATRGSRFAWSRRDQQCPRGGEMPATSVSPGAFGRPPTVAQSLVRCGPTLPVGRRRRADRPAPSTPRGRCAAEAHPVGRLASGRSCPSAPPPGVRHPPVPSRRVHPLRVPSVGGGTDGAGGGAKAGAEGYGGRPDVAAATRATSRGGSHRNHHQGRCRRHRHRCYRRPRPGMAATPELPRGRRLCTYSRWRRCHCQYRRWAHRTAAPPSR